MILVVLLNVSPTFPETSDEILAKYENKGAATKHGSVNENGDQAQDLALARNGEEEKLVAGQMEENTRFLDPSNLEGCFAFQDAKRKLRLVLSMCEIQPAFSQVCGSALGCTDFCVCVCVCVVVCVCVCVYVTLLSAALSWQQMRWAALQLSCLLACRILPSGSPAM